MVSQSPALGDAMNLRTTSTLSCETAYSSRPTALRASDGSM